MRKKVFIFILTAAFLAVFLYLQNNWIGVTRLDVSSAKLPENFEGFRIVQISDLHSKEFGSGQGRLISAIAGAKPDMIAVTGDLVDGRHYDEEASVMLVKKAAEIAPVYFVTGNHEWWSGKFGRLESRLKSAGAIVLRNAARKITKGGQSIYITGLDDPESTETGYNEAGTVQKELQATIPLLPADAFKVLLAHRPELFYQYSSYGIDLAFTGHAHGGQIRLPFIGGLYAPEQGYFPKFTSGVYRDGGISMVVSRGLGNSVFPQRLFNRPEVILVALHADTSEMLVGWDGHEQPDTAVTKKQYLINGKGSTVLDRVLTPEGFERVKTEAGSFGEYLRNLPLKPDGSRVLYYNGKTKPSEVYEAVLAMDVGDKNLQQCADSVIRLRAEYLYKKGLIDKIGFHFTNGFFANYSKWASGCRISIDGNKARWVKRGEASRDYSSFRKYLDTVFAYAGTLSLSREMQKVNVTEMRPGDVFMYGETPGHCEIVLDMAENRTTGEKCFILAQGYMPAQDMHILKNPANGDGDPWYSVNFGESLVTPEWKFTKDQLMRFRD